MKKITTSDAIDKLIYNEIDTIIQSNLLKDDSYIYSIFAHGFKGYVKFTKEELEDELYQQFGQEFKIVKKHEIVNNN